MKMTLQDEYLRKWKLEEINGKWFLFRLLLSNTIRLDESQVKCSGPNGKIRPNLIESVGQLVQEIGRHSTSSAPPLKRATTSKQIG